jgi:hypothetical protein
MLPYRKKNRVDEEILGIFLVYLENIFLQLPKWPKIEAAKEAWKFYIPPNYEHSRLQASCR